jgi:hypothetical protein
VPVQWPRLAADLARDLSPWHVSHACPWSCPCFTVLRLINAADFPFRAWGILTDAVAKHAIDNVYTSMEIGAWRVSLLPSLFFEKQLLVVGSVCHRYCVTTSFNKNGHPVQMSIQRFDLLQPVLRSANHDVMQSNVCQGADNNPSCAVKTD